MSGTDDFGFSIDMTVRNEWRNVDLLRTSVQNCFTAVFADVDGCHAIAMVTGHVGVAHAGVNPLRGQNNVQGACDMGALPNVFSDYRSVTKPENAAVFESAWGAASSRSRTVTEKGRGTPTFTSFKPTWAPPRRSTRKSAVRARMQPPATAWPFMAASSGFFIS